MTAILSQSQCVNSLMGVTCICVMTYVNICSHAGLLPIQHQATTWTNVDFPSIDTIWGKFRMKIESLIWKCCLHILVIRFCVGFMIAISGRAEKNNLIPGIYTGVKTYPCLTYWLGLLVWSWQWIPMKAKSEFLVFCVENLGSHLLTWIVFDPIMDRKW